ncbi:MAG TPA: GNAT family protein [Candidatus Nitrosopolaris sp.]|nr:GNAT family protein [Candidatus Nitrosopolaris sp.]
MRVTIRPPTLRDWPAFQAAVRRSRALHHPWVSPPDTRKKFEAYVKRMASDSHRGFLVVLRESGAFVGAIHLNNIIRGPLRGAFLGYYAFAPHAGKGLMGEGMRLVLKPAFQKLKLHRLEANMQPGNRASIRLARSCGFVREGFSRRYLKVGGRWRDHERWAILAENLPRASV